MVSGQFFELSKPASGPTNFIKLFATKKNKTLPGSVDFFLHYYYCRNPILFLVSNSDVCDFIMWPSNVIDPNRTTICLRIAAAHFIFTYVLVCKYPCIFLGRHGEARRVIGEICRLNGRPAPKQDILKWDSGEQQGISAVWAFPGMRRNLIILSLAWFRSVTGPFVRQVFIKFICKWDSGEQQGISAVWAFPDMRINLIICSQNPKKCTLEWGSGEQQVFFALSAFPGISLVDPDPVGSETFSRIQMWIRKKSFRIRAAQDPK
jgi:hypothetical protein